MLQALGEVVMFTDADLSAPIEEAEGLFEAIAQGADIAIGSRWLERFAPDHSPAPLPAAYSAAASTA